jgi:hypothetical protein
MSQATRTIFGQTENAPEARNEAADGIAGWIVLFAAAMVTLLTLFAGANLLGDRFDPAPALVWHQAG